MKEVLKEYVGEEEEEEKGEEGRWMEKGLKLGLIYMIEGVGVLIRCWEEEE